MNGSTAGIKTQPYIQTRRVLEIHKNDNMISKSVKLENSVIIPPCYIGELVELKNSIVGPHVSIGMHSKVENSVVSNSIIQTHSKIVNSVIHNSMLGHFVDYSNSPESLSLSDYSTHS